MAEKTCPKCGHSSQRRLPKLTNRECELVLYLTFTPMLNKQIAHEMHVGEGTIKAYLSRLFVKLKVPNREAVGQWYYENIVPTDEDADHD